ncbi:MAG: UDP-N-acetylmuramate dehydrogenase [Christensenellales bacterium]|nr:UDP-N-acetylmuramate dehydrogenase [Christensenellales bacterium]
MNKLYQALKGIVQPEQLLPDEPMSRHTTFRVGGPADMVYFPENSEQLLTALKEAEKAGVPALVMGNGSNMLVRDGGVRGLVIILRERFGQIAVDGEMLEAQAGASMARVAAAAQAAGLTGLEFASGIPGTLGGGCAMNAGAYGGQLSDVLVEADVLLDGEVRRLSVEEMEMGYRTSMPLQRGGIVLSARFRLTRGDPTEIRDRMNELNSRRREKQPLNYPSAGSTFKRPEGHFAGALIEQAGLKGMTVGGAQVSEKHAGFIINTGDATAADIETLIQKVQAAVLEKFGILLETEVRLIGE